MKTKEGGVMDIQKEKIKQEFWNWAKVENPRLVENAELGDVYATQILDHMFMGFAAAKAQANKQFESFIDQAIEDSACADERRSLQALLDEFQDIAHDRSTGASQ